MNNHSPTFAANAAPGSAAHVPQESYHTENPSAFYYGPKFFGYGLSQRGSSHIENNLPCQDFNALRIVKTATHQFLVAIVADGLGSCVMSHEGSRAAVQTVAEHCEHALRQCTAPTDQQIQEILRDAFSMAWNAIENHASALNQIPFSFYTTLTATVYDGTKLHIGHIGDGGVVAVFRNNSIAMVTQRHKGDTANSVYPLQSGENNWQFFTVDKPVIGYAVATDGVLDHFVPPDNYSDLIYEPFLTRFLFRKISGVGKLKESFVELDRFLSSQEYRSHVIDDITLFIVGNTAALRNARPPAFDEKRWFAKVCAAQAAMQDKSNTGAPPQAESCSERRKKYRPPLKRFAALHHTLYEYFIGGSRSSGKYASQNKDHRHRKKRITKEGEDTL